MSFFNFFKKDKSVSAAAVDEKLLASNQQALAGLQDLLGKIRGAQGQDSVRLFDGTFSANRELEKRRGGM